MSFASLDAAFRIMYSCPLTLQSSASEGGMHGKALSGGKRKQASAAAAELQYRVGRIVLIRNGKLVTPARQPVKKPR
jgi:hypothetical protein